MTHLPNTDLPLIVIGAGGHARVLLSTLLLLERRVLGFAEPEPSAGSMLLGIPCIGNDDAVLAYHPEEVLLVNGIGSVGCIERRLTVYEQYIGRGYRFAAIIHPSAILARDAEIAEGAQIMAGAIIQTGCTLRENSIINTGAQLDHDCVIDVHAHIAPGAVLSGSVQVGARAHVGAGATVIQGVRIGSAAIVGAGAVVLSDVPPSCTVVGVPARPIHAKA